MFAASLIMNAVLVVQIFSWGTCAKDGLAATGEVNGDVIVKHEAIMDKYNVHARQPLLEDEAIVMCGDLCVVEAGTFSSGPYFKHRTVDNIKCPALFDDVVWPAVGHGLKHSPQEMPPHLEPMYTLNGAIPIKEWYFDQTYFGQEAMVAKWSKSLIEEQIGQARKGVLKGTYEVSETNALREGLQHAPGIKNGRVLVIGSEQPWVESCVLEAGAAHVVTLEYGSIVSEHPQLTTMIPSEFKAAFRDGSLGLFDAIVSFSSIEHSGLGRYGDRLNPWGDVLTIAQAWCVCKSGGSLTLATMTGDDMLFWNAHRSYGPARWPYLTTNWKQHYKGQGSQTVHVFLKSLS